MKRQSAQKEGAWSSSALRNTVVLIALVDFGSSREAVASSLCTFTF